MTSIRNKLTNLCGNGLLLNELMNSFCEISLGLEALMVNPPQVFATPSSPERFLPDMPISVDTIPCRIIGLYLFIVDVTV